MFLDKVWQWIKGAANTLEEKVIPIAIAVTEGVQAALKSGVPGFLAKFVEAIFPQVHNLPEELLAKLQLTLPKVLAIELAIQPLAINPTAEQILAFETSVLDAFNLHDNKSKLYSEVAAQVFYDTNEFAGGGKHTFAEVVKWIEDEFQKIKTQVDAEANN